HLLLAHVEVGDAGPLGQGAVGEQASHVVGAAAQGDHPGGAVVGKLEVADLHRERAVEIDLGGRRTVDRALARTERAPARALGQARHVTAGRHGDARALAVAHRAGTALLAVAGLVAARERAGGVGVAALAAHHVADLRGPAGVGLLPLAGGHALVVLAALVGRVAEQAGIGTVLAAGAVERPGGGVRGGVAGRDAARRPV